MNKITLKFKDSQLEEQYQQEKLCRIRKQIFYGLFIFSFVLNIFKIGLDGIQGKPFTQYVNFIYISVSIISVLFVMKQKKFIKQALIVLNIVSGLLQMNFNEDDTTKQEFYSFGSSFAELQTVLYFVSDFVDGLIQVICHFAMKITITTLYSDRIDILASSMTLTGTICVLVTIYVSDYNSRKQFLSTICDNKWEQQLPFLINKPFIKLTYKNAYLKILSTNNILQFPGLEGENIDEIKEYLSSCKTEGQTIRDIIIKNQEGYFHKSLLVRVRFHRFNLRICYFGVEELYHIIVLEKVITKTRMKELPLIIRKQMQQQLQQNQYNSDFLRFFNWGMLSFTLLNNRLIKTISIFKTISKLNKAFRYYMLPLRIVKTNNNVLRLKTYINLFKIYMIQIYHILIQLHNKQNQVLINAKEYTDFIEVQILLSDPSIFLHLYQKNMFITSIERVIIWSPVQKNLKIKFSKHLIFGEV